MTLSNKLKWVA